MDGVVIKGLGEFHSRLNVRRGKVKGDEVEVTWDDFEVMDGIEGRISLTRLCPATLLTKNMICFIAP